MKITPAVDPDITFAKKKIIFDNYMKSLDTYKWQDFRGTVGAFLVYGDDQSGSYSHSSVPFLGVVIGAFEDCLWTACGWKNFTYWSSAQGGELRLVELTPAEPALYQ